MYVCNEHALRYLMSHKLDFLPSTADENQFFEDSRSRLCDFMRIFHMETIKNTSL